MSLRKYILIGQSPVREDDVLLWAEWLETADRIVFQTEVGNGVRVSTVFLGLDHRWSGEGPPLLFETMVFRDGKGCEQRRCSTWLEAEAQHAAMLEDVGCLTPRTAPPIAPPE